MNLVYLRAKRWAVWLEQSKREGLEGDEAEEEGRVRSKNDGTLLEGLKQESWEVYDLFYILKT